MVTYVALRGATLDDECARAARVKFTFGREGRRERERERERGEEEKHRADFSLLGRKVHLCSHLAATMTMPDNEF